VSKGALHRAKAPVPAPVPALVHMHAVVESRTQVMTVTPAPLTQAAQHLVPAQQPASAERMPQTAPKSLSP